MTNFLIEVERFFYVLGFAKNNQETFINIIDTESYLVFHHWFTIEEINKMSWLDFTIYVERVYKLYEEDEKRKAEEKKQQYEAMNANFASLAGMFSMN